MARVLGVSWQSHHRDASHARSGRRKERHPAAGERRISLTPSSVSSGQMGGHRPEGLQALEELVLRLAAERQVRWGRIVSDLARLTQDALHCRRQNTPYTVAVAPEQWGRAARQTHFKSVS